MQNSASSDDKIYFLIDQPESAGQTNANALLARDVYRNIANFIDEALGVARQARQSPDPMHHRYHNTVLIDGDRGTGKSTVLVNLACYLKAFNEETLSQVHICAPVDPTLLEDHDDLFLNVILAAVLSDKKVEEAQRQDPQKRQALAKQLQKLGSALEHMQSQREQTQKGMDKLRAFVGNQQLIQEVHDFFAEVLKLLDKKLLILTIDDVDTGLDKAFENLEVVRRYLTSPYVMPIISGDLSLYHEVIWRKFHGRLLKDSKEGAEVSVEKAEELAREYERKILPVQYRQKMPDILEYLTSNDICLSGQHPLRGHERFVFPFRVFYAWLEALVNGTVNGLGSGFLLIPIPTVRALAQLLWRTQYLIPVLRTQKLADLSDDDMFFRSRERLLQEIKKKLFLYNEDFSADLVLEWLVALERHFQHEESAAPLLLVLQAMRKWQFKDVLNARRPLDLPLFSPISHLNGVKVKVRYENKWREDLKNYIPDTRLKLLPEKTTLPFPCPQIGAPISSHSMKEKGYKGSADPRLMELCCAFVLHYDFYTASARASQRYMGRVFELIVLSFVRDVRSEDVWQLLKNPPFHSVAAYANLDDYIDEDEKQDLDSDLVFVPLQSAIEELTGDIKKWRKSLSKTPMIFSPWLVFNVMQRCFSVDFRRQLNYKGGNPPNIEFGDVFRSFGFAFFNIWSAFAYFEKGALFDPLSGAVSSPLLKWKPIDQPVNYLQSPMYKQTISGLINFTEKHRLESVTSLLAKHPLCKLALQSFGVLEAADIQIQTDSRKVSIDELIKSQQRLADTQWIRKYIFEAKGIESPRSKILPGHIKAALQAGFSGFEEANCRYNEFIAEYGHSSELSSYFASAIKLVFGRSPEPIDKPTE